MELPEFRTEGKGWVVAQISVLLIVIAFLLFMSILFGVSGTLGEINTAVPIIAVAIALLSFGMATKSVPVGKVTYAILMALVITFLGLITLLLISQDLYIRAVTTFTLSTVYYMMLGLLAALALTFSYWGKTDFITWEKTKIWRDLFFLGVAVWFVFGMTFYLSVVNNTPFETTPFLGVPFSAAQVDWHNGLIEAGVKGAAGFIEGSFFLCMLGMVSVLGITKALPSQKSVLPRLLAVAAIAVIFGSVIAYLHTGLHDISQRDVLMFIGLFFFAGAVTTLYFETSFAFVVAQGCIDFMKGLFGTGDPGMTQLAWAVFLIISVVALFGFITWNPFGRKKK